MAKTPKKEKEVQQFEAETPRVRALKAIGYLVFIIVLSVTAYRAVSLYRDLAASNFAPVVEYTAARAGY
jgi:hypothetical protein